MSDTPITTGSPRRPRKIARDGLPLRWIIAGVIALHLGFFALLSANSDKIMGAVNKKEPQNFYFAEEVYEVEEGQSRELVRVREFTVSTKLWEDDGQEIQPDTGPELNNPGANLPTGELPPLKVLNAPSPQTANPQPQQ